MPSHPALPTLLALLLTAGAAQAAALDDCNAAPAAPPAAAAPTPARAYWLDGHHVQWPGLVLQPGERVRLHHARAAGLSAVAGQAVSGADGAVELRAAAVAVPARFRFIGDGPRFAVPAEVDVKALLRSQLLLVREAADGRVIDATGLQLPGALDDLYAAAGDVNDLGVTIAGGSNPAPASATRRCGRSGGMDGDIGYARRPACGASGHASRASQIRRC